MYPFVSIYRQLTFSCRSNSFINRCLFLIVDFFVLLSEKLQIEFYVFRILDEIV